ncbi:HAD family hydrolase [Nocardia sp. NPDC050406]|uniref:HAD family hydrolase n=1 Tax=Nocardia sp. NPDC050406 TaxID=3364318 RepID=UPI003796D985
MTVRGILFDIDDTLIDYSGAARVGLLRHLEAEGLLDRFESPDSAVALWKALEEHEYVRYLHGELTFPEQQIVRTERFLTQVNVTTDNPRAWFDRYVAHRNSTWSAFPDAPPLLHSLTGRTALGVVSNSALAHQVYKLDAVGLLPHFGDAVLCSQEHGAPKPDPSIFLAGCALLGLPAHEVAYVGDRYDVDGLGARDAGLRAYWLDRTATATTDLDGVTVIGSLAELRHAVA